MGPEGEGLADSISACNGSKLNGFMISVCGIRDESREDRV
jgi:hypothetical protein